MPRSEWQTPEWVLVSRLGHLLERIGVGCAYSLTRTSPGPGSGRSSSMTLVEMLPGLS